MSPWDSDNEEPDPSRWESDYDDDDYDNYIEDWNDAVNYDDGPSFRIGMSHGGPTPSSQSDVASLQRMILGYATKANSSAPEVAIDCEMVGTGPGGATDSLARVSAVGYDGQILLDTFVRQTKRVTDYRTHVSGVKLSDVESPRAKELQDVRKELKALLEDRILIGFSLSKDLELLCVDHPSVTTIDVQESEAMMQKNRFWGRPGLKLVIRREFNVGIQGGQHDSVTDARAAMAIYRRYESHYGPVKRVLEARVGASTQAKTSKTPSIALVVKRI